LLVLPLLLVLWLLLLLLRLRRRRRRRLVLRLRWLHVLLHHWRSGHSMWWQCNALRRGQLPQARVLHLQSISRRVAAVVKKKRAHAVFGQLVRPVATQHDAAPTTQSNAAKRAPPATRPNQQKQHCLHVLKHPPLVVVALPVLPRARLKWRLLLGPQARPGLQNGGRKWVVMTVGAGTYD
jgi:hypothetical protein